jgi:drug/metabolite transporter (DMT)-like permease
MSLREPIRSLSAVSEAPLPVQPAAIRNIRLGYLMAAGAATLWAVNGTVSKVILASGVSSSRLTEVRSSGALVGLVLILLAIEPRRLRIHRRDIPFLAVFGIAGLAFVQWFYFLSIHRLAIGIALLVEYLAPLLVALTARYVFHEPVRRRIWLALALALAGLALIVDVRKGGTISTVGLVFCGVAAVTYALYLVLAEHAVADLGALPLLAWGFGFATLFWSIAAPWWSFPGHRVGADVSLLGHLHAWHLPLWALMSWMVVLGTIVPFLLIVTALRHLPATRVGIIAMLEPVVATIVAWAWLGESFDGIQLVGAGVVLMAIVLAQTAR